MGQSLVSSDLAAELNDEQREAVLATEGPVLVLAGAGSGKTRVLTYRAAWLIRSLGIAPETIVAVTFTNKAAGEMKERIARLLGGDPGRLRMGTFHSLCLRMLRADASRLGYRSDFVVYDTADQTALMKEVSAELRLDTEKHPARSLLSIISAARNRCGHPDEVAAVLQHPVDSSPLRAWEGYAARLRAVNAMDFDDLLLNTLRLFAEHPDVLARYQAMTQYLLVDEYQDTNRPQYEWVAALAAATRNLCVVGDDAQSIYRFRGADIGNILRFTQDYPDARTVKLTRNYRSTGRILQGAGNVIRRNKGRIEKELWTENPEGDLITWMQAATDREEAAFIAGQIDSLRKGAGGCELADIAILYRTNAQSRLIEESLIRAGLPYRIFGGLKFYDRKEVKDLIAYLRAAVNPTDDVAMRRILNVPPRGLGKVTLDTLEEAARAEGISLYASVKKAGEADPQSRASRALRDLAALLADTGQRAAAGEPTSALLGDLVTKIEYAKYLQRAEPGDAESRLENVGQLIAAAQDRESQGEAGVQAFLDAAALVADAESVTGDSGVSLMTLHCAKGLEFPVVFMAGMEENLFPHARSRMSGDQEEIEEERRLCYVGMTRAMRRLFMTAAASRRLFGGTSLNEPSRFISEIGPGLLRDLSPDWSEARQRPSPWRGSQSGSSFRAPVWRAERTPSRQPSIGDEDVSLHPDDDGGDVEGALRKGMRVFHAQFGYGEVEGVEGAGEKEKATVRFSTSGTKRLMTHYAGLRRVAR